MFDSDDSRGQNPADPPDPAAELAELAERARALVRTINADAGRLPAECVVLARRVTDVALEVLAADPAALSTQARLDLGSVIGDYLPTTLSTYVAATQAGSAAPERLVEQLAALYRSVADIADAVRGQGARAFDIQGNFLSQRFSEDVL